MRLRKQTGQDRDWNGTLSFRQHAEGVSRLSEAAIAGAPLPLRTKPNSAFPEGLRRVRAQPLCDRRFCKPLAHQQLQGLSSAAGSEPAGNTQTKERKVEPTNPEVLNHLIAFAANRRLCAVHFMRHNRPGITVGRVDACDSRMVFVAQRTHTSAIPLSSIVSVVAVGGGA
jgi:hypothetical protein